MCTNIFGKQLGQHRIRSSHSTVSQGQKHPYNQGSVNSEMLATRIGAGADSHDRQERKQGVCMQAQISDQGKEGSLRHC